MYHITLNSFTALKILCAPSIYHAPPLNPTTNLWKPTLSVVCLFPNVICSRYPKLCHLSRLASFGEEYALKVSLPSPLAPSLSHFFSVPKNILLHGWGPVYVSIHLLKDILVASEFWQL